VTVAAVLVALVITGAVSASLGGGAQATRDHTQLHRGSLAVGITYVIGHLAGAAIT
jgi:VIT1/CCC1 family predicted Fe2+/Mn2+ transporter